MGSRLALFFAMAVSAAAQWEVGGLVGYGAYRNGSIISPAGNAHAGIRSRFTAGAVIGEDLYQYIGGELRYLYQDGDPFIESGGVRSNIQGQSHAVHYDMLFHLRPRESRLRPFAAAGIGAKWFVTTADAPLRQPLERIGVLNPSDQVRALVTLGGGIKYDLRRHLRLRLEFRDYITPFPKKLIAPGTEGTARGILHQFTPLIGISSVF